MTVDVGSGLTELSHRYGPAYTISVIAPVVHWGDCVNIVVRAILYCAGSVCTEVHVHGAVVVGVVDVPVVGAVDELIELVDDDVVGAANEPVELVEPVDSDVDVDADDEDEE